jgi:hypothetical protein
MAIERARRRRDETRVLCHTATYLRLSRGLPHREFERLDFEGLFGLGEFIAIAGYPNVHGWEEEDAHD